MNVCTGFTGGHIAAKWFFFNPQVGLRELRNYDEIVFAFQGPAIVGGAIIRGGKTIFIYPKSGPIHDKLVEKVGEVTP